MTIRSALLVAAGILVLGCGPAAAEDKMTTPAPAACNAEAARSLAPGGRLRVAINLGNSVLAQKDPATGELGGVSVALAKALAERLALPLDLTTYPAAGEVFKAMETGAWDVAFLAAEPERAEKIAFSPAYVFIDGTYLVKANAPYRAVEDLDRPGRRIAVGKGAAYDLFLSRSLKAAELVRAPTSSQAIDQFLSGGLDAAAGVRQNLVDAANKQPGLRVLDGSFQRIEQAMGTPRGREAGAACLTAFVEAMKASGFVRAALDRSGQAGAVVAPPAR